MTSARAAAADDAASFYAEWSYSKPSDVVPYVERFAARGDPASVLRAYDDFGASVSQLRKFLRRRKGEAYGDELAAIDPTTVIEIGTFLGYSAIATAMRFARDEARLLCVECRGAARRGGAVGGGVRGLGGQGDGAHASGVGGGG